MCVCVCIYIYIYICKAESLAIQQKLTQHCKLYFNKIHFFKKSKYMTEAALQFTEERVYYQYSVSSAWTII